MTLVLIVFLVAAFSGSANPIFIRFGVAEIPPITFSALRMLVAAIILFPIWQKHKEIIPAKDLVNVLPYAINMGLYAIGIQYTSATMGSILYTLAPILSAVLAYFFLREKLSRVQILGAMSAVFGTAILIFGSIETKDIFSFGTPLGNMLIGMAVCSWGFYPIGIRNLSKKYANTTILFHGFVIAGGIFLLLSPLEWLVRPLVLTKLSYVTVVAVLGSSIIGTVFYYFCYQWLIKHTTAFIGSLSLYGGFIATSFYGAVFLGEHFTSKLFLGTVFVLLGVFLVTTYQKLKKRE